MTLRRSASVSEISPSPVLRAAVTSSPVQTSTSSSNNHSLDLIRQQHEIIRQQEQLILQQRKQIEVQLAILQRQQQATNEEKNDRQNSQEVNAASDLSQQLDIDQQSQVSANNLDYSTSPSQLSHSSQDTQLASPQHSMMATSQQLTSSMAQDQLLQSIDHPDQLSQTVNQQEQLLQTINQQDQLSQSNKQQDELLQSINQQDQLSQSINQQDQQSQSINQQDQLILNPIGIDEYKNQGLFLNSHINPQQFHNLDIQEHFKNIENMESSTKNEGNIVHRALESVGNIHLDPFEGCSTFDKQVDGNVLRKRSHSEDLYTIKKLRLFFRF